MKWLALLLLFTSASSFAADPTKCHLKEKSVVSRSSTGVPQVSNVGDIEIACTVPARSLPTKPGDYRMGLMATTTTYEIAPDDSRRLVPSNAEKYSHSLGRGAEGATLDEEFLVFYVYIPLETAERDAEIRKWVANFAAREKDLQMSDSDRQKLEARTRELDAHPEQLAEIMNQHRLGHFQVECHVIDRTKDGEKVLGSATVDLEVIYKGRFSEMFPPR